MRSQRSIEGDSGAKVAQAAGLFELTYPPLLPDMDSPHRPDDLIAGVVDATKRLAPSSSVHAALPLQTDYLSEFRALLPEGLLTAIRNRDKINLPISIETLKDLNIAQCAAVTYILSHDSPGPSLLYPTETLLNGLKGRIDGGPGIDHSPVSTERLQTELTRMRVPLESCPPELVRALDELNMLCARLELGKSVDSILVRTLSSLDPKATPPDQALPLPTEPASWLNGEKSALPAIMPKAEIFESFAEKYRIHDRLKYLRAVQKAAFTVPQYVPPPADHRLYPLVACALIMHESGISGFDLGPSAALDSRIVVSQLKFLKNGSAARANPAKLLKGFGQDEQLALAHLVSELDLGDLHAARSASRLGRLFETIGERPFSFGDLLSAALMAGVSKAGLSSSSSQLLLDPAAIDLQFFKHAARFKASYLNARDLHELGVAKAQIPAILLKTWQAQLLGLVKTREGALAHAVLLSRAQNGRAVIRPDLCARTGADIKNFVNVVTLSRTSRPDYRITRCHSISRQQFSPRDPADLIESEVRRSHNYPQLDRWLGPGEGRLTALLSALKSGQIRNLVELEYFCASLAELQKVHPQMKAELADVVRSGLSTGTYAKVERLRDIELSRIAVCIGYHAKNHVGMGLRHVIEQRCRDGSLAAFEKKSGRKGDPIASFIDEAVLQVAATGLSKVPSARYPKTHLLLSGAIEAAPGHFLTLVVANTGGQLSQYKDSVQVVTALYHTSSRSMRNHLRKELLECIEQQEEFDRKKLEACLLGVNSLLGSAKEPLITLSELGFRETALMAGEEEEDLALGGGEMMATLDAMADSGMLESIDSADFDEEPARATASIAPEDRPVFRSTAFAASRGDIERGRTPAQDEFELSQEGFLFNPVMAKILS